MKPPSREVLRRYAVHVGLRFDHIACIERGLDSANFVLSDLIRAETSYKNLSAAIQLYQHCYNGRGDSEILRQAIEKSADLYDRRKKNQLGKR